MNEIREADKDDERMVKEYKDKGKISEMFHNFPTYDLCQVGYPLPHKGVMVPRYWGGTDKEGNLLPSNGMFCKTSVATTLEDGLEEQKNEIIRLKADRADLEKEVIRLKEETNELREKLEEAVNIINWFLHSFGNQLWSNKRHEVNTLLSQIKEDKP